jgi:ATP-dependent DNA helicase RecQ
VLDALTAAPRGLSIPELMSCVNVSFGRISKTIDLLALESPPPIVKQGTKWQLTATTLSDSFWERADRLTGLRRAEQQQMQEYVWLTSGHMAFLIRALDGNPGRIRLPALQQLPTTVGAALVREAVKFLRRTSFSLELRKRWPAGGMPEYNVRGNIRAEHQANEGKVLCVWGDAGWGELVRRGKFHDGRFSDELVTACVKLIRQWTPNPTPKWVTCIPSRRHLELVPDFATRLAIALNLRFHPVLKKIDDRPEQKTMANSTQQARNIDGSLEIEGRVPSGPVLLVDDMVDSRWTLTVAAWLLRTHGSGDVFPLALASAGHGD